MRTRNRACSASSRSFGKIVFSDFFDVVVRRDVVDADLHAVEARLVEALDPLARQEIRVRVDERDHALLLDVRDGLVDVGIEQRLTAGQRHEHGAQARDVIDALLQRLERNRRRDLVVLVAVAAAEVAAARDDEVRDQRAILVECGADDRRGDLEVGKA